MQDFLRPNLLLVFEMELPKVIYVRDHKTVIVATSMLVTNVGDEMCW